jgi:phosphoribosylanthranilate isomerase
VSNAGRPQAPPCRVWIYRQRHLKGPPKPPYGELGYDAVLVGTSIMSTPLTPARPGRPGRGRSAGEVMAMTDRAPFFKVCGLTRAQDVAACLDAGAAMTGFIFAARSPRRVTPEQARALPAAKALRVGVFVEQSPDEVLRIMDAAGLDLAQLHGGQDAAFCRAVGPDRVIKALWPEKLGSPRAIEIEMARFAPVCRFFLLDAGTSGGGHGRSMISPLVTGLHAPRPWLLAGGLGPENLGGPECDRADGLDLNSGLEKAPGGERPRRHRPRRGYPGRSMAARRPRMKRGRKGGGKIQGGNFLKKVPSWTLPQKLSAGLPCDASGRREGDTKTNMKATQTQQGANTI